MSYERTPITRLFGSLAYLKSVPAHATSHGHPKAQIVVDYAHTPEALAAAQATLRAAASGKIVLVFGWWRA